MGPPLILDTDGGVDDAQALLMLVAGDRPPASVTTVFGNVAIGPATANVLATLAVAGRGDIPVHVGADRPLVGVPIDATRIHGADGLGGAPRPEVMPDPAAGHAVDHLRDRLRTAAGRGETVDLLMIGPLTNLALALRTEPAIGAGIGRLVVMGGTVNGRGNVTPAAEFNILADPEAAAIVLTAGLDTTLVPWETCAAHRLDGAAVDRLFAAVPDGPARRFTEALSAHARRTAAGFGAGDILRFVDPLAAAVAIDPGVIRGSLTASVDVSLAPGPLRGAILVDPTGRLGTPPVTIVTAADLDALTALYAASLRAG